MEHKKNKTSIDEYFDENTIRNRTAFFCLLSTIGIYLGIYSHSINLISCGIVLVSLFFCSITELYCELFYLLPFTMIFKLNPASTSLYTYLSLVFLLYIVISRRKVNKRFLIMLVCLACYLAFGSTNAITEYIKLIVSFLLAYFFINEVSRKDFPKIVLFLTSGVIISAFIGLRKSSWPALANFFSSMKSEYINGVSVNRFTGLYLDPNYFSIIITVCLVTVLLFSFKKEIRPIPAVVISAILIIFGCLTYSKVFYLTLLLVFIFAMFIRMKVTKKYFGSVVLVSLALIIGVYLAYKYGIASNIIYRFSAGDMSNNRLYLWKEYYEYICSSIKVMLFGVGIGAGNLNGSGVHNYYLEIWYYLGFVGGIMYISMMVYMLKSNRRITKRNLLNYSLLIILLFMFSTLGMLLSNDLIFIVMIIWVVLNTEISFKRDEVYDCKDKNIIFES